MRVYTVHIRQTARRGMQTVLVREGFTWGALILGPLWLAVARAWIPAALALAAAVAIGTLTTGPVEAVLATALALLLGFSGQDLRRWSLARRGFALVHVVAARDVDAALQRLLSERPNLRDAFVPAGLAA